MSKEKSLLQKWATEKFNGIDFLLTTYNSESMEEYARFYHAQQLEAISDEMFIEESHGSWLNGDVDSATDFYTGGKWVLEQLKNPSSNG